VASCLLFSLLQESTRALKNGGLLFVQGTPGVLPELGVFLEKQLIFKYWFAVESTLSGAAPLPSVHAGVMLFTKGKGRFNIKQVRLPHQQCKACKRPLKDWGGKAHLMNPAGYVISDVIKDLPAADNYSQISKPLFDILIQMLDFNPSKKRRQDKLINAPLATIKGLVGPVEALSWKRLARGSRNSAFE